MKYLCMSIIRSAEPAGLISKGWRSYRERARFQDNTFLSRVISVTYARLDMAGHPRTTIPSCNINCVSAAARDAEEAANTLAGAPTSSGRCQDPLLLGHPGQLLDRCKLQAQSFRHPAPVLPVGLQEKGRLP